MRRLGVSLVLCSVIGGLWAVPADAAFPGANGDIAYGRTHRVWVLHPDGTRTRLGRGEEPAWSPDGTRIAFLRYGRRAGNANIWTMNADGTDKVRVTTDRSYEANPAWSPDGTMLVFSALRAPTGYELYVVPSSPPFGEPVQITSTQDQEERNPRWSPDGTSIAFDVLSCPFECGTQIGIVDPDGSGYRTITPFRGVDDVEADWSPDSQALLFASNRADDLGLNDWDIYSIPTAGGEVTRVTRSRGDARAYAPVWSPNGAYVLYVAESATEHVSLVTEDLVGGTAVDLGRGGSLYDPPDWQAVP